MISHACLLAAALALTAVPAAAFQNNVGAGGGEFLKIGAGARALGMGEAFSAVAEGPEALYWNPAGLAYVRKPQGSYSRSQLMGLFSHDHAAYAHPAPALAGTLAGSYTRLSQKSLPLVTNANVQVGEFAPHSDALTIGYAHAISIDDSSYESEDLAQDWTIFGPMGGFNEPTGKILFGISVKAISETIYDQTATAFAIDTGAIIHPSEWKGLSVGLAVRNAGTRQRFISKDERLPLEVDCGAAYDHRWERSRLIGAFEAAVPYYGNPYAKAGVEYGMLVADKASIAVRAGYKTQTIQELGFAAGVTYGVGLQYGKLFTDLGFQPMAQLGESLRLTVGLRW